jgi:GNAT superfamily N-acetyltransferase
LAIFERAEAQHTCTQAQLLADGFGDKPAYTCIVAECDGNVVGISLFYDRYSTWKGMCLYLEDLIVTEKYRGMGIGLQLFNATRTYARTHGYCGMQWQVLDWNTPAIDFYKTQGATIDTEWYNGKLQQNEL